MSRRGPGSLYPGAARRALRQARSDIEARRKTEHEKRLAGDPRLRVAETPALRVAKLLRKRLGDDFDAFMADLKMIDRRLSEIEVARIQQNERGEGPAPEA